MKSRKIVITALVLSILAFLILSISVFHPPRGEHSQAASISPADGASHVPVVTKITVTFGNAVTLDKRTIERSFSIEPYVTGSFYWTGSTMIFLPKENLEYNTTYTITVFGNTSQFRTASQGFPLTVTDDLGRSITIGSEPERIISLAPSNTEILFALGLGGRVIGVTEYCNYPEEAKEKEKIGGYVTPNIEKIVALQPDLILAAHGLPMEIIAALEGFNLTVAGLYPKKVEDILYDIRLVGELTGQTEEARALVAEMADRIGAVESRIANLETEKRPKVIHIIWHDPIWVAGTNTFEDELIHRAGGSNCAPVQGYKPISLEEVIHLDPEVIITPSGSGMGYVSANLTYEYIRNEPRLKDVAAVRTNRVYVIDADIVCRAGPRIVVALEELARDIQPALFAQE